MAVGESDDEEDSVVDPLEVWWEVVDEQEDPEVPCFLGLQVSVAGWQYAETLACVWRSFLAGNSGDDKQVKKCTDRNSGPFCIGGGQGVILGRQGVYDGKQVSISGGQGDRGAKQVSIFGGQGVHVDE